MTPVEFADTIYLGDRAIKSILLDGWKKEIKIQVDSISRVRGETWNFYVDENLDDGFLVMEGVVSFKLEPCGLIPDDWIELTSVRPTDDNTAFVFEFVAGANRPDGLSMADVYLTIIAASFCLESSSGIRIRS